MRRDDKEILRRGDGGNWDGVVRGNWDGDQHSPTFLKTGHTPNIFHRPWEDKFKKSCLYPNLQVSIFKVQVILGTKFIYFHQHRLPSRHQLQECLANNSSKLIRLCLKVIKLERLSMKN